jgi:RNA polymerase sigma-70 factor (ECF subfamily)
MNGADADRRILEGIRREDPGAFEEFVRHYGGRIYGFGMRVCGETEDAKDVAQDTLIQAYRALKGVKDPRALRSWLYRVVSNACLMRRRKKKDEPQQELALEDLMPRGREDAEIQIPDVASLPDDELLRGEIQEAVHAGIRRLPPDYRVVLLLRDIEQLTTREAAFALELPESTVKMRLHRARVMLRRELAGTLGQPPDAAGAAT